MTHLCVSIFATSIEQVQREIALAAEAGADMVELRIDEFNGDISGHAHHSLLPAIVTYRPTWEGGRSQASDQNRMETLGFLNHLVAYVDVEFETFRRTAADRSEFTRLIVSSHDFAGRPDRLYNILQELSDLDADVNKIVWTARSIRDNIEAFEILQSRQKPTIALCMGEAGLLSRVLAKKFGAFLTFASLDSQSGTAPGQVSIADMKRLYRWDAISANTKVYGVVASPVKHSMSPAIHNACFDEIDYDGVYLPMLVEQGYESFKAFMETFLAFKLLHLSGLSVTLPHKENALRYLKEKGATIEPLAEQIGAVNTIKITQSSVLSLQSYSLEGINTDYAAILDSITAKLGCTREELANYRVAVIGAGGTGRTAVAALASYGATVVVYNRTKERADELAKEFDGKTGKVVSARLEKLCDSCCHVYINTTSVGMHPNVNESPVGDQPMKFSADTVVFDTIYNPMKTKLLQQAESAGAKTIGGVEMFIRQAAGQFKLWTGKDASHATMRRVIEQRLGQ